MTEKGGRVFERDDGPRSEAAARGDVQDLHAAGTERVQKLAGRRLVDAAEREARLALGIEGDGDRLLGAGAALDQDRADPVAVDQDEGAAGGARLEDLLELQEIAGPGRQGLCRSQKREEKKKGSHAGALD